MICVKNPVKRGISNKLFGEIWKEWINKDIPGSVYDGTSLSSGVMLFFKRKKTKISSETVKEYVKYAQRFYKLCKDQWFFKHLI